VHRDEPLISVALCTFNGATHLPQQLDSLLAQTYRQWEVVAVDDCSTDDTLAILQDYERRDSRIRVFANTANLGFSRNFALAITQCRGDFIAPCDQDDLWLPEKLQQQLLAIGACSMAYCDSILIDAAGKPLDKAMSDWWRMQDIDDPLYLILENCVSGHAMLFRRDLLGAALPMPAGMFHDWWLAAVAASQAGIAYLPLPLVQYRQHDRTVTNILRNRTVTRPVGVGIRRVNEIGERLARLSALAGPHQALLAKFQRLWVQHTTQWLSFRLALFMLAQRARLFALRRRSTIASFWLALQYVTGVRLKRLAKRRKYTL
jgi:hypothetical protein